MQYIPRMVEAEVRKQMERYPSVTIYGPRQCGKTTLARHMYPDYDYVNLENITDGVLARQDPQAFFEKHHEPLIIDEIQEAPDLIPLIQYRIDASGGKSGQFVLTGSRQIDVRKSVSQSLVGRTSIVWLDPLSMEELGRAGISIGRDELLFSGLMPGIYQKPTEIPTYYQNYVNLYLQRDVLRQNISDMDTYFKFMQLLAGRTGQLVDYVDLSDALGISNKTVKNWMELLENSHLVHILQPWFSSREKRLVKTPKVYFCDTGLVCYLLGISSPRQVANDRLIGSLFETLVVDEAFKMRHAPGQLSFYRTSKGVEVDLVVQDGLVLHPFEIKSASMMNDRFGSSLRYFQKQNPDACADPAVIYAGEDIPSFNGIRYVNYLHAGERFKQTEQPFVLDVTRRKQLTAETKDTC